jgi:hypothetical protein
MKTWAGSGLGVAVAVFGKWNLSVAFRLRAFKDILQGNNGGGVCGVVLHAGMSLRGSMQSDGEVMERLRVRNEGHRRIVADSIHKRPYSRSADLVLPQTLL